MTNHKRTSVFFIVLAFFAVFFLGAASAHAATLSADPAEGTFKTGNTFSVSILLDTEGAAISGVDINTLNYDPALLRIEDADMSLEGVQIGAGSLMDTTLINEVDQDAGTVTFSQVEGGGNTFSGSGTLATITFSVLDAGTADVGFTAEAGATDDTNVASGGEDVLGAATGGTYALSATQVEEDNTPPEVAITAPQSGSTLSGTISVSALASDESGIDEVSFSAGGNTLGTLDASPYEVSWDTTNVSNGDYTIHVTAFDMNGNSAQASTTVVVLNETEEPDAGSDDSGSSGGSSGSSGGGGGGGGGGGSARFFFGGGSTGDAESDSADADSAETETTATETYTTTTLSPIAKKARQLTGPFAVGMRSSQVSLLQEILASDPSIYPEGMVTGYYGTLTRRAVERFQIKYNIVSSGTPATTGFGLAGPTTRREIREVFGNKTVVIAAGGTSTSGTQTTGALTEAERQARIEELKTQLRELQALYIQLLQQLTQKLNERLQQIQSGQ